MNNGPNWKWIVGILLLIVGFAGSFYINMVQGQFKDRDDKDRVIHQRLNKMDEEKVDKDVLASCLQGMNEKLNFILDDLKSLKKMHQKN